VDASAQLERLAAADLSSEPDRDVREAIDQMGAWLRIGAESERDLLCFYH